jgi:hypothetical protein
MVSPCPDCHGAGGRTVSEFVDGEHRWTRREACEHCDDCAEEHADAERLSELVAVARGICNLQLEGTL